MPKSFKIALIVLGVFIFIIPLLIFMFGVFFIEKVQAQSTVKDKVAALKSVVLGTGNSRKLNIVVLKDIVEEGWTNYITTYRLVFNVGAKGKVVEINNVYKSDLTPQYKIGDTIDLTGKEISESRDYPIGMPTGGGIPEVVRVKRYLQLEKMNIIPADSKGVVEYTLEVPYDQFTIYQQKSYMNTMGMQD